MIFTTTVWTAPSMDPWHFVSLPLEESDAVRAIPREPRPGFGSIRVLARIGATEWNTSIFPDSKSNQFVLPVKKAVRKAESIEDGDEVTVKLELLE